MSNPEMRRLLDLAALKTLDTGQPSRDALPDGVELVDFWKDASRGAALFSIDASCGLTPFGQSALDYSDFELTGSGWRKMGGGGLGIDWPESREDPQQPRLRQVGSGRRDSLGWVVLAADPLITLLEVVDDGHATTHAPGLGGISLLGISVLAGGLLIRGRGADGNVLDELVVA